MRAYNAAGNSAYSNTASATTAAAGPTGRRRLNGTTDYIDFPGVPQVNQTSVAFFFTPLSLPTGTERDILLTYSNQGETEPFVTHDKQLFLGPDGIVKARVYRGGPVVAASTTALTVGTRYHVGFTVSGTALTIYVNGVAEGTVPATGSFDGYSNPNLRLARTGRRARRECQYDESAWRLCAAR